MKILQVCNKVPYPPKDGGAIAILNLATAFSEENHEVTILAMNTEKHFIEINEIPEVLASLIRFELVPVNTRIKPATMLLNLLFSRFPYNAQRFLNKKFERKLLELISLNQYDIIQLEGLYLLPYLKAIRKKSKSIIVFRAHNIEHEIWQRIAISSLNRLKKFYSGVLARRIARMEKGIINTYDLLLPITDRDANLFLQLGNYKPMKVVPAGIPENYFKKNSQSSSRKDFFFLGSLDWIPNQEGLIWFLEKVWKKLIVSHPDCAFHIAGRNAPEWLKTKLRQKGITFHGEIDDAHAFFDLHHIMVVPLFAGSGMRIKIIEAMARSKVIVTTTIGAEGLHLENGVQAIIEDDPNNLLVAIDKLLENRDFFSNLEENSFAEAGRRFNNKLIAKELLQFYKQYTLC